MTGGDIDILQEGCQSMQQEIHELQRKSDISPETVSKIFHKQLDILLYRLSQMLKWPERKQLIETTPLSFRRLFKTKVAVIIDCFEVYIQRPTNLKARAQTWSSYKHHNTVKFLIGISPQGVIAFISKAWGGRASDKYFTDNCNLLQNLLQGDIVLAGCGF